MAGLFSGLRVLVSGAGLGGLCLAQALRRADVDVQVFERDPSPRDGPQGSRRHIDSNGVDALPPARCALFTATAVRAAPFTTLLDTERDDARLGRGANVALRDALAAYEAAMTAYGVDVVRRSAAMGTRLMGQHALPA